MSWMKWTAIGVVGALVVWPMIRRKQHPVAEGLRDAANDAVDKAENLVDRAMGSV